MNTRKTTATFNRPQELRHLNPVQCYVALFDSDIYYRIFVHETDEGSSVDIYGRTYVPIVQVTGINTPVAIGQADITITGPRADGAQMKLTSLLDFSKVGYRVERI